MSNQKVPLQVYLSRDDRDYYVNMHKQNGTKAAEQLRSYIQRKIKDDKKGASNES